MSSISSSVFFSGLEGIHFLYSNRICRSYQTGASQQGLLCVIEWISHYELLHSATAANLEAALGSSFSQRFAIKSFKYGVYALIPGLHYLSNYYLDEKKHPKVKSFLDKAFLHVPDIIMLAGLVQSAVALYFGVNTIQNVVHFSFYLLSYLEQGMSFKRPTENDGILVKKGGASLINAYDSVFGPIFDWTYVPMQLLYGGIGQKLSALIVCFPLIPPEYYLSLLNEKLSKFIHELLNIPQDLQVTIEKVTENQKVKKLAPSYGLTEKLFHPFKIGDLFPKETVASLKREVISEIQKMDPSEEKERLEELLGHDEKDGTLVNHLNTTIDPKEKEVIEIYLKNLFGTLKQKWKENSHTLFLHYDDFLCRTAITDTLQKLNFEIFVDLQHGKEGHSKSVAGAIAHILQEKRDLLFDGNIQGSFFTASKVFKKEALIESSLNEEKTQALYKKIKKTESILTREWWQNFKNYAKIKGKMLLSQFVIEWYLGLATNRHQINASKVYFGEKFGISGLEDAASDLKKQITARGLPSFLMKKNIFIEAMENNMIFVLRNQYFLEWKEQLLEAIINPADPRLTISEICGYINSMKDLDKDLKNELFDEGVSIEMPSSLTHDDLESYQKYFLSSREYLKKALPLVLEDLGYLKGSQDPNQELNAWSFEFAQKIGKNIENYAKRFAKDLD